MCRIETIGLTKGIGVRGFGDGWNGWLHLGSEDTLLVVLELHDEGLDVLALGLPRLDAPFSVGVEVLLLLVEQRLGLQRVSLLLHELLHGNLVLDLGLVLLEFAQFLGALTLLLASLLFGYATGWRRRLGGWWPPFGIVAVVLLLGLETGVAEPR